jgi:acetyltransferase
MTIRNLDYLFKPRSIALIGASRKASSVGAVLAKNLFQGGFDGPILPVNPKHRFIQGVWTYPDVGSLPITPDLAVISTPATTVPAIMEALGEAGTRAAIVISAGFGETAETGGHALQQAILNASRPYNLRIVGPNCLGLLVPGLGINASFAQTTPEPGHLAFVTQSGAIVTSILDWAKSRAVGFSHLISLGDMADIDFGDTLDYLANQHEARAILLYIEAVSDARKFMSAARAAARMKPVIVVKSGRYEQSAKAATSHTGALAGNDEVYDAAFRRAGMLRVYSLEELFDAAETLAMQWQPKGDRLAVLTNGGGIGVLATDAIVEQGARAAELAPQTIERLNRVLPDAWSHGNPVDILGDASGERYAQALEILSEDANLDATLVLNCPTAVASSAEAAKAVIDTVVKKKSVSIVTSWVGDGSASEARRLFAEQRIPTYDTPEQAVRAFMHMVNYQRNQNLLMETPPSVPEDFTPELQTVRGIVAKALAEHRTWLNEPEAKQVLAAYGIAIATTHLVRTPDEAAARAAQIAGAVALKIVSPDITHKSDVGGVALDLAGPAAVRDAARSMHQRITALQPEARLSGFSVQPMVHRPGAYELVIGATEDAKFGPVILFGQGGKTVEIVNDKALALPPLNMRLAHELISRTRIYKLLQGYRNMPAANLDAIAMTLIRVAQLVIDIPEIRELDINPLLADEFGVITLDARVRVQAVSEPASARLAIRPYPKQLEETIQVGDGREVMLRPIVPEDEPALQSAFTKLTPEEVRLRFFVPKKTLSHFMAVRFTQIDYDREMGLILTEPGQPGKTEIFGVGNVIADPDNVSAEYAIVVRHDMVGLGLGIVLMRRIIDYARNRGIKDLFGHVLRENRSMLKLCKILGFTESFVPDDPSIVSVSLALQKTPA